VIVIGGVLVACSALLAGTAGFGFSLVSAPFLLLSGFSLPFVVTANLLITLVTRSAVAWRLRGAVHRRRVTVLVIGAVPGLWVGSKTLAALDGRAVHLAAGTIVTVAAAALAVAERRPRQPRIRGLNLVAGFLGGLLGTATSLTGVPPALLLARRRLPQESFFADLAVFFVVTAALGLGILAVDGHISHRALISSLWWLPGVLLANVIGTTLGLRLPARTFRAVTLTLAFVAGITTIATA
jgi:uncharacterized membrane protein YfcA